MALLQFQTYSLAPIQEDHQFHRHLNPDSANATGPKQTIIDKKLNSA